MSLDHAALPSRPSPGAAGARLGELYSEHARMVLGICRVMLRDSSEAEDATQQAFLSAYRSLLGGTQVEKAGAWLGTIARNECRARIESRMRAPLAKEYADTVVGPALEEQVEGRAAAHELYAELAALPPMQREAVVLRDVYGLRYAEVATALGTSKPAVEALLFRARRRLQHRLRPRLAAGALVVPLAIQESLAYAVPGFASGAVPAGAAGAVIAAPLLAKLVAGGAAVVLAGSAGVVAEKVTHDRPAAASQGSARPTRAPVVAPTPPAAAGERRAIQARPVTARAAGAAPVGGEDGSGGPGSGALDEVETHDGESSGEREGARVDDDVESRGGENSHADEAEPEVETVAESFDDAHVGEDEHEESAGPVQETEDEYEEISGSEHESEEHGESVAPDDPDAEPESSSSGQG